MILYRIAGAGHVRDWRDAFTGEGSFRGGGRWSSVGTRMVYASTHLSLAALEVLVHCDKRSFRNSRVGVRFSLPDELIQRLPDEELPEDWASIPESVATQRIGDAWVEGRSSAGLIVPSAVLPDPLAAEERNVLLNPLYPGFLDHVENPVVRPFGFDRRIGGLVGD